MTDQIAQQLESHGKALRSLARDLVGEHVADDLVQDTALQALESPPSRPGPLGGWFATVLRRLASKHRRRESRRAQRERHVARPESTPSEAETLAAKETLTRLTAAVLSLPQPYQDTIVKRYLQEQPPREIAASTQQSIATVKSQLRRGLQMLRARLEETGGSQWKSGLVLAFALGVAARDAAAATGVAWSAKAKLVAVGAAALVAVGVALAPQFGDSQVVLAPDVAVAESTSVPGVLEDNEVSNAPPRRVAEGVQSGGPSCEVRVVDSTSGLPVAGARVLVIPHELDMARAPAELAELRKQDPDAFLYRVSPFLETDERGTVRVPSHDEEPTGVVATKGATWGRNVARAAQSSLEVRLRPDRTLRVRVVDARGRVASGMPVELRSLRDGHELRSPLGASDEDGLVVMHHVQMEADDEAREHVVLARCTGGEGEPVGFDPNDPPREVVVSLPPTGIVRVRLCDAVGRALNGEHFADPQVGIKVRDSLTSDEPMPGYGALHAELAPIGTDGEAVFSHVTLGKYVQAIASKHLRSALGSGPTAEHPVLTLELREPDGLVILTGRLVDEAGVPARHFEFTLLPSAAAPVLPTRARTDADGRFRLALDAAVAGRRLDLSLRATHPGITVTLGCLLAVSTALAGTNDLGDLVLSQLPLLAKGRVFVAGKANVRMQLERRVGDTWEHVMGVEPAWTPDREFAMHGAFSEPAPLRLRVGAQGLPKSDPVEFEPGATSLAIVLQRGGTASTTLLLAEGVALDASMVRMRRVDGSTTSPAVVPTLLEPATSGRAIGRWRSLPSGSYRLEISAADGSDMVHVVDGIEIGEGPCRDPRLIDIDLRTSLRSIEVRVLDANGAELRDPAARVIVRGGDGRWTAAALVDGLARVVCGGSADLLVLAPGHEAAFVDDVAASRTLRLVAATTVAVRLAQESANDERRVRELHFTPRLGAAIGARFVTDSGFESSLEQALEDTVTIDAEGRGTWTPRFATEFAVSGRTKGGPGGSHWCGGFQPRTVRTPCGEEVVLQVEGR